MFYQLILCIWTAIWRRLFGSDFKIPLIGSRAFQHGMNFAVMVFAFWMMQYEWCRVISTPIVVEFYYWAVGHGPAFDMGRAGKPDDALIARYKKYFWNSWCEFLVPEAYWYGFGYDLLWMEFRYALPAILASIVLGNLYFVFAGLSVPLIYAACWALYDRKKIKHPTELAEVLSGFVSGLFLYM